MFLLLCKVLPLFLLSKLPFGTKQKDKILNYSGGLLTDGLLQVGPLYIKMGQIISTRDDAVPAQWIKKLERLQDQVPAKSGDEAYALAYEAWPGGKSSFEEAFSEFDPKPYVRQQMHRVHCNDT